MVISKIKTIGILGLTGLLAACSGPQSPAPVTGRAAVKIVPRTQAPHRTAHNHNRPQKLAGQWTVDDIVQTYGDYVADQLGYYFQKAHVAYPPREIALVALKQEKKMELWARDKGEFKFIRDYFIMAASGDPGPKLHQGDRQVPEGIYRIVDLNPNSHYHMSMRIDYPNEFDRRHAWQEGRGELGGDIYIHGKHASIGCLAMGDEAIEELFVLTAQVGPENVRLVIAPHDPKKYPLTADIEHLPEWTPELYAMIEEEIATIRPRPKMVNPAPVPQPCKLASGCRPTDIKPTPISRTLD